MLKKSLVWFALPIIFWPPDLFNLPLSLWVLAACEEGLKAFASTREDRPIDKFWLVALCGVWELTLSKPLWGWALADSGEVSDRLALSGMLYATALPVLMHTVTAAIYAFTSERWLWAAFAASWLIHAAFNESAHYFGLSPALAIAQTAILALLLAAALHRRLPPRHQRAPDDR